MLCRDIMNVIEITYPRGAALSWDNVGLLVGRVEKEVKKIYVALDVTDEVIDNAISLDVDLLITHHPLLFSPLKQITTEQFIGNRVVRLLQHDISYAAMHTNYDVLRMGELSGSTLGLMEMEVLELTDPENGQGIGRVGKLPEELSLQACCELVKERFGLTGVKVFGEPELPVRRVAISPGSGKHMTELAIAKHADVFVTAEIDHHEGIDALARKLAVIDAGHSGLEQIFVPDMADFLQKRIPEVTVYTAPNVHPFQYI